MAAIETIGKAWTHPKTGEVRYYIDADKAAEMAGITKSAYGRDARSLSNSDWSRLMGCKIWVDTKGIHFKGFMPTTLIGGKTAEELIVEAVRNALKEDEPEEIPETETITTTEVAQPMVAEVSVTSAQTTCKGHMAVLYVEPNIPAVYLGEYTANHSMTTEEILDQIGLDMDTFADDMGWDGFYVDAVRTVPSEGCDLERGDEVPEVRVILDTSAGLRYIEVPDVGEALWDGVELYDEIHGTTIYDDYTEDKVWADDGAHTCAIPYDPEEERIRAKVYRDLPVLTLEHGLSVNEAVAWSISEMGYGPTAAARAMAPILGREVTRQEVGKYINHAKTKM